MPATAAKRARKTRTRKTINSFFIGWLPALLFQM
jgi:hypothetical protein